MVTGLLVAIYVHDLVRASDFYCALLDFEVAFSADWCVQLASIASPDVKLMLQPRSDGLVPEAFRKPPQGVGITFSVPDCDAVYERAQAMALHIVKPPTNEAYGQRRFLTVDPDGTLIDISSRCEPSPEFIAQYMGGN
ncbi:MAG: VOC family protein [Pseudomonadota bacterium]